MSQQINLQRFQKGFVFRCLSPALAALLILQASGCAFHTYKDIDRSEWPQLEEKKTIRVFLNDSTVHNGKLAVLRLALDTASLVDSSILAGVDGSKAAGTMILVSHQFLRSDTLRFSRNRVHTDTTYMAVGDINRVQIQKSATVANIAFVTGCVTLWLAMMVALTGGLDWHPSSGTSETPSGWY